MDTVVDTSVWSLAYRRDTPPGHPAVAGLRELLARGTVATTGVIYLELLRGFTAEQTHELIAADFDAVRFVEPTRADYATAADLSIACRRAGVQLETVDALIAQLCIAHDLTLLTTDQDFVHAARHVPLRLWPTP